MNPRARPGWSRRRLLPGGIALVLGALFLTGCDTAPQPPHSSTPGWIALQHTPGSSPSAPRYTVTLFEDGKVLFEGQSGVKWTGTATRTIDPQHTARVFRELDAVDFWNRPARYDVERADRGVESTITKVASQDAEWDIISARHRGRFKRIDGLFFAPYQVLDLKKLIETTVGLGDWVDLTPPAAK